MRWNTWCLWYLLDMYILLLRVYSTRSRRCTGAVVQTGCMRRVADNSFNFPDNGVFLVLATSIDRVSATLTATL